MAIAVNLDPLQNNASNTTGAVTCTAFSPSAGDVIVVSVGSDTTAAPSSYTIADSTAGALTWVPVGTADFNQTAHQGAAAAWMAFSATTHPSMTVTVTIGLPAVSANHSIKVTTLTAASTSAAANVVATGSLTANSISPSITTAADGCLVMGVALNMSFIGAVLSTDTIAGWTIASHASGGHVRKAAITSPAGAVTLNWSQASGNTYAWTYLMWAVMPPQSTPGPVVAPPAAVMQAANW